jgi:hypothetical protein
VGRSSEARKEEEGGVYWGRGEGVVETWQNGPKFVSYGKILGCGGGLYNMLQTEG